MDEGTEEKEKTETPKSDNPVVPSSEAGFGHIGKTYAQVEETPDAPYEAPKSKRWFRKPPDIGIDRYIEIALTCAITYFAFVQWRTTVENNKGTTDQTDKLILAGQVSAMAAEQNAAAAKSFSASAGRISKSMDAAVVNLGTQATNTEAARQSSVAASNVAIEATRAANRAYVLTTSNVGMVPVICSGKINKLVPDTYCVNVDFKNFGETPASNLEVFASVQEGYENSKFPSGFVPCIGFARTVYFRGEEDSCIVKSADGSTGAALANMALSQAMMHDSGYTANGWIEYDDIYNIRRVTPFCFTYPVTTSSVIKRPHACKIVGNWYPTEHENKQTAK